MEALRIRKALKMKRRIENTSRAKREQEYRNKVAVKKLDPSRAHSRRRTAAMDGWSEGGGGGGRPSPPPLAPVPRPPPQRSQSRAQPGQAGMN